MIRGLLFLCLLASAFAAFGFGPENLLKKYGNLKILTSCYGEEVISEYVEQFKVVVEECRKEKENSSQESSEESVKGSAEQLQHQNVQFHFIPIPFAYNPFSLYQGSFPHHFPQHQPSTRAKRQSDPEDKLAQMKQRIINKVENAACHHKKLDFMDENGMPKPDSLKAEYEKLNISKSFKDELKEGLSNCYDVATCLPPKRAKHPLVEKLGTFATFTKCLFRMELLTCMKQDFFKSTGKSDIREEVFELITAFGSGHEDPDFF